MFRDWPLTHLREVKMIRSYSVTTDILSYKRCRRQYGFFNVRGYRSSSATQRYFGTMVHDVLDQLYRMYKKTKRLPDGREVVDCVEKAHVRLIQSGVRAVYTVQQKEQIVTLIRRFLELAGQPFFANIRETEYTLERSMDGDGAPDFVLEGIVDVLAGAVSHALGLEMSRSTTGNDVEIWDYKSGEMPAADSQLMADYQYQMNVYAELYYQQTGIYPARCVLMFIGELNNDRLYNRCRADIRELRHILHVIHPSDEQIGRAMTDFRQTVACIEGEKQLPYATQWQAPNHDVDRDTCIACELRYHCPKFSDRDRHRREPL